MRKIYISIGSNTADREHRVLRAISNLEKLFPDFKASAVYSTPCHNGLPCMYSNAVGIVESSLEVEKIEVMLKALETENGRALSGPERRTNVPLDLDIVVDGDNILRPKDYARPHFRIGYEALNP